MNQQIRLMIADDHLLFIDGLKLLLKEEEDICVTGVAHNGKELLQVLPKEQPDVVLLDINMPGLNGLEAARHIKTFRPQVKVIMLSTYNEDHLVEKAKQYGANGYLLKNSSRDELTHTIRLVMSGHACFPYQAPLRKDDFRDIDPFLKQFNLTKRELEILRYIKQGLTNQQISDTLFLSIYTVETHRKNIMQKLGMSSITALMKFVYEHNI